MSIQIVNQSNRPQNYVIFPEPARVEPGARAFPVVVTTIMVPPQGRGQTDIRDVFALSGRGEPMPGMQVQLTQVVPARLGSSSFILRDDMLQPGVPQAQQGAFSITSEGQSRGTLVGYAVTVNGGRPRPASVASIPPQQTLNIIPGQNWILTAGQNREGEIVDQNRFGSVCRFQLGGRVTIVQTEDGRFQVQM